MLTGTLLIFGFGVIALWLNEIRHMRADELQRRERIERLSRYWRKEE